MGVSRLTGMNSEAIRSATHNAIEPTALHIWREEISTCGEDLAIGVLVIPSFSVIPAVTCGFLS